MTKKRAADIRKVAEMMRDLDFCMFTTRSADGRLRARPMSNNGEVEFDGDVWFFSGADTRKVEEIEAESRVELSYADTENFRFISMSGDARIVRDTKRKKELWLKELERWFEEGPESDDVVLIKVTPSVVAYWSGEDDGEITLVRPMPVGGARVSNQVALVNPPRKKQYQQMVSFRRLLFATCATGLLSYLAACTARSSGHAHLVAPDAAEIFHDGVISDANEQWRIAFTRDGKTAYFAESPEFFPFTRKATIYVSEYAYGKWSTPVIAPFSGTYSDIDPFISPDGRRLYFSSIRPVAGVPRNDIDIWMVERTRAGWSDPVHLGPEVNSPADELYPSASADGTLYFASGPSRPQPGGNFDIYSAARNGDGFAPRKPLGSGVNTGASAADPNLQVAWEFNPEISVDGRTLVFTSLRPGGFGLGDLYVSYLEKGVWTAARNLGPRVNTASDEYHPTLSRDQRALYFVRRGPDKGNFYRISTRVIEAFKQ